MDNEEVKQIAERMRSLDPTLVMATPGYVAFAQGVLDAFDALAACRAENERLSDALNQARELYKIVCSAVFVHEPESMRELQLDRAKELDNIIAAALQSREH